MLKAPFEPCIPTPGTKVPDSKNWLHEIKHDGYRLIVQRQRPARAAVDAKRPQLDRSISEMIVEAATSKPQQLLRN